jgi:hypothetical protein
MTRRCWKPFVLAVALALGGAVGFFAADAEAAPGCGQICCPDGTCFDCSRPQKGGPCMCPLIFCA